MSISEDSLLQTLPVEILNHIFDRLDAETIFLSVRNTCRRLQTIVNKYDRFNLNFKLISKPEFHFLCKLIDPRNVTSLTLSHDEETIDQIELFLSYFSSRQFNRLRSLTLLAIEERHLKLILKRVNIRSLTSFSLKIGKSDGRRANTTAKFLSSVMTQSNLVTLELDMHPGRIEKINWPSQYTIQYLRIGTHIEFDCLNTILRCLSHLRILFLSSLSISDTAKNISASNPTTFPNIISLTIEYLHSTIDILGLFLLLTPSLTYLKLIGHGNFLDGHQWEQLIQGNLPLLNKFELFVQDWRDVPQDWLAIELIISSYRTPFWLEHKKWFITCEIDKKQLKLIKLFSVPLCISSLIYESEENKISVTTFSLNFDNHASLMDNINTIQLNFMALTPSAIQSQTGTQLNPLFRKVKCIELLFGENRPLNWLSFVSTLIDLKAVIQIKLVSTLIRQADTKMLTDVANLLRQTCKLSSLDICCDFFSRKSKLTAHDICSLTPSSVKHLAVSIKNLKEAQNVVERFKHLSSANFSFEYIPTTERNIDWIAQGMQNSTYRIDGFSLSVWLGKQIIRPSNVRIGSKRIKLINDHHDS